MAKWVCSVCGYVYEGEAAPAVCPVCKAPSFFHGSNAFPQPELSRQSYKTNFPVPVFQVENIPASDFAKASLRLKAQKNVHLFLRVLHGFL